MSQMKAIALSAASAKPPAGSSSRLDIEGELFRGSIDGTPRFRLVRPRLCLLARASDHQEVSGADVVGAAFELGEDERAALLCAVLVVDEVAGLLVVDDRVLAALGLLADFEELGGEHTLGLQLLEDRIVEEDGVIGREEVGDGVDVCCPSA